MQTSMEVVKAATEFAGPDRLPRIFHASDGPTHQILDFTAIWPDSWMSKPKSMFQRAYSSS